jgi:CRISPR/Cas system CMR subunit Cmr4 (Cas7 group RAMP superfamily)
MIPASRPGRRRFGNPLILAAVAITAVAAGAGVAATDIQDLPLLRAGNPGPGGYGSGSTSG